GSTIGTRRWPSTSVLPHFGRWETLLFRRHEYHGPNAPKLIFPQGLRESGLARGNSHHFRPRPEPGIRRRGGGVRRSSRGIERRDKAPDRFPGRGALFDAVRNRAVSRRRPDPG